MLFKKQYTFVYFCLEGVAVRCGPEQAIEIYQSDLWLKWDGAGTDEELQ
jgi:hypothetical protein